MIGRRRFWPVDEDDIDGGEGRGSAGGEDKGGDTGRANSGGLEIFDNDNDAGGRTIGGGEGGGTKVSGVGEVNADGRDRGKVGDSVGREGETAGAGAGAGAGADVSLGEHDTARVRADGC